MKQIFHKISSVLMAIVVLFSTISFTVDMHYCGDSLVETAIFHEAEGCGMEMEKPSTEGCSTTENNCCSNEQLVIEGQDELKISFDNLTIEQQFFVASFVTTYINRFESLEKKVISYEEYGPPLVVRQIYKLDETFLI